MTDYPILTEKEVSKAKYDLYNLAEKTAKKFVKVFEKMDYKWSVKDGHRVPTKEEIDIQIRVLTNYLYSGKQTSVVSTGRLQLRLVKWNDNSIEARIELIAEIERV